LCLELVFQHQPGDIEIHFAAIGLLEINGVAVDLDNDANDIGGNVANGSPIGDSMPALLTLDARLELCSTAGTRELPLAEFYLDYRRTALAPGEFVKRIVIPRLQHHDRLHSYKVSKRFDQDISAVCGAFRCAIDAGRIDSARVAYGGLAATPKRALACERALAGQPFTLATIETAMRALDADFDPIDDMRASAGYRRRVAKNLLLRYYRETAAAQAGLQNRRVYDYGRRRLA